MQDFIDRAHRVVLFQLLRLFAVALGLDDEDLLVKLHNYGGRDESYVRYMQYYDSFSDDERKATKGVLASRSPGFHQHESALQPGELQVLNLFLKMMLTGNYVIPVDVQPPGAGARDRPMEACALCARFYHRQRRRGGGVVDGWLFQGGHPPRGRAPTRPARPRPMRSLLFLLAQRRGSSQHASPGEHKNLIF